MMHGAVSTRRREEAELHTRMQVGGRAALCCSWSLECLLCVSPACRT